MLTLELQSNKTNIELFSRNESLDTLCSLVATQDILNEMNNTTVYNEEHWLQEIESKVIIPHSYKKHIKEKIMCICAEK
ncbi:hypothetical protein AYI69_g6986 [Smittium culicis]|uniref:Uncharacterized protein n=2 Tax=Smittium culicis TaxID=133412 RepID=A0A1R1XV44_9FUNG|nr:hypothetical protein AYI69_g6986 [Smittium culicis]